MSMAGMSGVSANSEVGVELSASASKAEDLRGFLSMLMLNPAYEWVTTRGNVDVTVDGQAGMFARKVVKHALSEDDTDYVITACHEFPTVYARLLVGDDVFQSLRHHRGAKAAAGSGVQYHQLSVSEFMDQTT